MTRNSADERENQRGCLTFDPTLKDTIDHGRPGLRKTGEQIGDRLATAVALGEYLPGQRLPRERQLSASLQVSRYCVRQALHLLADAGYVEIRRGRTGGAYVVSRNATSHEMLRRTLLPNWRQFERIFELRNLIDPALARFAAQRRTREQSVAITAAANAYRSATDRTESGTADLLIHALIAEASDSPYVASLSAQIRNHLSFGLQFEAYSPALRERAIREHLALAEAIAARRPREAEKIAIEHTGLTESAVRRLYAEIAGQTAPREHMTRH